jgi:peptide/nickel transport system substrate-binding protein/oligopeptide transport system substrate-binding protein
MRFLNMTDIETFLKDSMALSEKVGVFSQSLNNQGDALNELIQRLEDLFQLLSRSDNLVKIIRDYSTNFRREITGFRQSLADQEARIQEITDRIHGVGKRLEAIEGLFTDIHNESALFIASAQSLAYLAKNAEIRAYQAKGEGRGLAIIAKEALSLARLAQVPFRNLGGLLENLRDIARPVAGELTRTVEVSARSKDLLTKTIGSLQVIDETNSFLHKIITGIEQNTAVNNQLKGKVSGGLGVLKDQLRNSLKTVDDLSIRSAEIHALAQILRDLNAIRIDLIGDPGRPNLEAQFRHWLRENVKVLNKMTAGKEPPLFPEAVHKDIVQIQKRITEMSGAMRELVKYGESLGSGMGEVSHLETQIDEYYGDTQGIFDRLQTLGQKLDTEFAGMEKLLNETGKVSAKIKTLAVFARIEEGRCPKETRMVISPIVAEFARLEQETERALLNVQPRFSELQKHIREMVKDTRIRSRAALKPPDYAKIKLYLDDIIRVFNDEETTVQEVVRIAGHIYRNNPQFMRDWQNYENSVAKIILARRGFEEFLKTDTEIVTPALAGSKSALALTLNNDPVTLHPDLKTDETSHAVIMNFSNGLFEFGLGSDILPGVCEEYEIAPDGTECIFRIREGVRYHDGQKLKVEDIKDGLLRALVGPNGSFFDMIRGSRDYQASKRTDRVAINVINNRTLQIKLEYPFLPILANLAANVADPYRPGDPPIGIGPYKVSEWQKGERVILEAHDQYFGGRPAVDELRFLIVRSGAEGYELFKRGVLDIFRPGTDLLDTVKKENPQRLHSSAELSVQFIGINCQKPPFNNKYVRKALAYAIDNRRFIRDCMAGDGIPARGIFPPAMRVYNPKLEGYHYSPERARSMLAEAGYPNGLPDTYSLETNDTPASVKRAEFIRDSLAAIGVRVEVASMSWKTMLDRTYGGKAALYLQGWVSDNGDPDNFLYPLFHSRSFGLGGNTFFYSNPDIDRELDDARKIRNMNQRIRTYRQLEQMILDDAPAVFLFHTLQHYLVQDNIKGFRTHPLGLVRAKYLCRAGIPLRPTVKAPGLTNLIYAKS